MNERRSLSQVLSIIAIAFLVFVMLSLAIFSQFGSGIATPALPSPEFLGEGGRFNIPEGFFFLVKEPHAYACFSGTNLVTRYRVWKTDACGFEDFSGETVSFGSVIEGCRVDYVIVDDDVDNRLNVWQVDGQSVHTVTQGMVSEGSFTVSSGGELSLVADDSIAMVTEITCNNAPQAVDDTVTTLEDTPVDIDVTTNDGDIDGNLDPGSVMVTSEPQNGSTAVDDTTGVVTYTPNENYFGDDSFDYEVCDTGIPIFCDSATVFITVIPVQDLPDAVDDSNATDEDTLLSVSAPGVLDNDTDPDPDDMLTVIGSDASSADGAVVSVNADGSYIYDPTAAPVLQALASGAQKVDTFVYTIGDGHGNQDSATVSILVTGVNDAPIANDDTAVTTLNTAVNINVVANDSDIDGVLDLETLSIISGPSHGSLGLVLGSGQITYDPGLSFWGFDSFVYQLCDDGDPVLCDTATVTVTGTIYTLYHPAVPRNIPNICITPNCTPFSAEGQ